MNLREAKVLVTGGHGFLGRHVVKVLNARGVEPVTFRSAQYDLRDWKQTEALFAETRPDVVIHIAWTGGGIGYMRSHPGSIARDNTLMACHVFEASRAFGAQKVVGVGSVCSYPKFTKVPFREEDLWLGYPEETNAPYGISKKMMLVLTQSFADEFGLNGVHLLMVNMYGPWDNFDLQSSHVIPAMMRKFLAAKERGDPAVTLWGDGSPTREFVYITDAAEALRRARPGQHRLRHRSLDSRPGDQGPGARGVRGDDRLGHLQAQRPAAAKARRYEGQRAFRVRSQNAFG